MKKKIVFIFILFSIIFSGCFLQMPESVSIKTNATYNVRIGKFKESFGSLFDINQLSQDQNTSDLQMKVFDYNPNGSSENVQQFLTKIPIQEIPIDFGKYMEKTDIFQSISKISAKQEIEIPKIDLSTSQSFPFDSFKDLINGLVSFGGIAVNGAVNFLNKNSFDTVTYDYGTIIITNPKKDLTGSVKLIKDGVVLSEGNFVSGEANLSFLNTTFYSEGMIIEFSEPNANKDYVATFTEDSNFANVSGFTVDNYSIPIKTFVNFNLKNLGIEECVIEEGTLETSAEIPYSWNNISLSYDLNFSNLFEKSFNPNSEAKVMDMKDLEISDKELFVSSNIILSANNATIDSFSLPFFIFKLTVQKYKKIGFNLDASNYKEALKLIKKEIKLKNVTEEELENAKKEAISSVEILFDNPGNIINYYFGIEIFKADTIEDKIKNYNKVTTKDIEALANKIKIAIIYFLKGNTNEEDKD